MGMLPLVPHLLVPAEMENRLGVVHADLWQAMSGNERQNWSFILPLRSCSTREAHGKHRGYHLWGRCMLPPEADPRWTVLTTGATTDTKGYNVITHITCLVPVMRDCNERLLRRQLQQRILTILTTLTILTILTTLTTLTILTVRRH